MGYFNPICEGSNSGLLRVSQTQVMMHTASLTAYITFQCFRTHKYLISSSQPYSPLFDLQPLLTHVHDSIDKLRANDF